MSSKNKPPYERLDLQIDIARLRDHLQNVVMKNPPFMQSQSFGGWSVWSADGELYDGWSMGHTCYKTVNGKTVFDNEKAIALGLRRRDQYRQPTEICTGYLNEVMNRLFEMQFNPRRVRLSLLRAGGSSSWHRDGVEPNYAVRLHIPIVTDPLCTFECEDGVFHFPADGAGYVVRVNRMHQICNRSKVDRYHLMMDIFDFAGVTQEHRFDPETQVMEPFDL